MVYVYVLLLGLSHYLFLSHYRNPFWVVFSSFFTMGKPWDICWDIFTAPSLSSCLDELQASVQTTQTFQRCSESLRLGCEARLLERGQLRSSMESENKKCVQMWLSKLRSDKEWEKCPYHQFMSFPWSSISSTLWTEAAFFFVSWKVSRDEESFVENRPAGGGNWTWRRCHFDVCGSCVVWRFAVDFMSFCQVCVSIPLVLLFFCALAIKYGHFIPRKVLNFWWVISQSDSGAMVLAHESCLFFCAKVWSHLCQSFASHKHQKRSWKLIEEIAP